MYRAIIAVRPERRQPAASRRAEALARGLELVRADDERARRRASSGPLAEVHAAFPGADFRPRRRLCRAADRPPEGLCAAAGRRPFPLSARASNSFRATISPGSPGSRRRRTRSARAAGRCWTKRDAGFRPYVAFDPTQPVNQWAELNHSPRWSAWFFWEDGERQDENCARCPATAAALEALPLLDLPGKGPTAMFSILEPRTRIPPHTGSSNVRTTVHLPARRAGGLRLPGRVGDARAFEAGKAWAFDDTIEHEAWNDSDEPRAILILDVWNPLLSEAERAAVRVVG